MTRETERRGHTTRRAPASAAHTVVSPASVLTRSLPTPYYVLTKPAVVIPNSNVNSNMLKSRARRNVKPPFSWFDLEPRTLHLRPRPSLRWYCWTGRRCGRIRLVRPVGHRKLFVHSWSSLSGMILSLPVVCGFGWGLIPTSAPRTAFRCKLWRWRRGR